MRALIFCLALAGPAAALAADAGRPPAPPGLSWSEADSLHLKLLDLEKRKKQQPRKPETVLVTQGELNSFLNLTYAAYMPKGVTDVSVKLDRDRIEATGMVDLEKVGAKQEKSRFSLMSLLAPTVPVLLRGRLVNQGGFGSVEWEEVRLSAMRVPLTMLETMVSTATRSAKYPNGWDIRAPFRLPYSARRIRLEPGRAFLDF